jgi:hypothetical protein
VAAAVLVGVRAALPAGSFQLRPTSEALDLAVSSGDADRTLRLWIRSDEDVCVLKLDVARWLLGVRDSAIRQHGLWR